MILYYNTVKAENSNMNTAVLRFLGLKSGIEELVLDLLQQLSTDLLKITTFHIPSYGWTDSQRVQIAKHSGLLVHFALAFATRTHFHVRKFPELRPQP